MKIYKIIGYVYLAFAVFFLINIYDKIQNNESYVINIIFIVLAVFMFFFRMRNYKKFKDQNENKK